MSLVNEFLSYVDAMDQHRLDYLKSLNVNGTAIAKAGLVGITQIETENKLWQPEETGRSALIIPAGPDCSLGSIIDLVAVETSHPHQWWSRTGLAPFLGYENLARSIWYGSQLTIHSTPLDWLKSECEGIVILDWERYLPMWLSGVASIYCPDPQTGNRLSSALSRNIALPEIRVGDYQHAA